MSTIKGLVFDLDGVITDTAERHFLAWQRIADGLGISIDREWNERLKGISRTESLELILAEAPTLILDAAGKTQLLDEKNAHYLELIAEITAADILPGIPELLEAAKEGGCRMAIASASKNAPIILARLGLSDTFDSVIDPDALTHNKPHPEIFEKAAQALGLRADECIGFEDSLAGIEGIKRAGMPAVAIGIPTFGQWIPDIEVDATRELDLKKIFSQLAMKERVEG
ncbi:beta-phosphoglucomutase [Trichococcus patagoniensis]|uniref:Beta-phosphoglucomutase n=1 Tax=Trichococcus patagoniensis TaxID=382641 RepID=A0A2T5IGK4_9LACT|nr:beta-phosphoglucomutase [Trichococcus patagoniensis]PTQ82958.1 beta-phosphoglucomutase [Trichococcus patagoniensis]